MKKLIFSLLTLAAAAPSFAQSVCVPGTLTSPKNAYIIPDSAANFANGCVGTYYEQILYIKAAKDTIITITTPISGTLTANIDSFVVDANILGMPSYLTVESVPGTLPPAGAGSPKSNYTRLSIPGDSLACVKISGNIPVGTPAAVLPLTIGLRVYTSNIHDINVGSALDALIPAFYPGRKTDTLTSIGYYSINVVAQPCWPTTVSNLTNYGFDLIGGIPNPADQSTRIAFQSANTHNYTLTIVNLLGEQVWRQTVKATNGVNYIPVQANLLNSGLYVYTLSDGINNVSGKLQIQH
ncbi:MAG: T9SS type A sorting domain-containing protein [Chitinophagaceae bacterium]|nr:T9SS type A sorting domain-containing protein [Chitinophagaceae bacterium]